MILVIFVFRVNVSWVVMRMVYVLKILFVVFFVVLLSVQMKICVWIGKFVLKMVIVKLRVVVWNLRSV